jgi:hypothetical protein
MLLTLTRLITAALLIAAAAAFATGATIEHHTASSESHSVHQEQRPEAGTAGENPVGAEGAASGESSAAHAAEHSSETLLGINPEATGLVVTAVAVSVLLAALAATIAALHLLAGGAALLTTRDTRSQPRASTA